MLCKKQQITHWGAPGDLVPCAQNQHQTYAEYLDKEKARLAKIGVIVQVLEIKNPLTQKAEKISLFRK